MNFNNNRSLKRLAPSSKCFFFNLYLFKKRISVSQKLSATQPLQQFQNNSRKYIYCNSCISSRYNPHFQNLDNPIFQKSYWSYKTKGRVSINYRTDRYFKRPCYPCRDKVTNHLNSERYPKFEMSFTDHVSLFIPCISMFSCFIAFLQGMVVSWVSNFVWFY